MTLLQVLQAELHWSARPLSPQLTEAFGKIKQQVDSVSEQVARLQLSVDSMQAPAGESQAGSTSSAAAASSAAPQTKRQRLMLALEAQAGLSSGLTTVQQAVDEWFTGLHGFPPPPALREQALQRGQRLSKKATDQLSRRRHLPLRVQALSKDRSWPLSKAVAVYELVMERHSLSLAELRDGVRLSSPVRDRAAKGGKPASSELLCRAPGLPPVSVVQFAAWVQEATADVVPLMMFQ